jgi:aspartate beta-hydroxylase
LNEGEIEMSDGDDPATLLAQGRLAEAEAACERRLESQPDDVAALNIVALGALRRADATRALELLERAARVSPDDAVTWLHLGRAREAAGDLTGAVVADEAAVRADPAQSLARLHFARGLERQGEADRALLQFARALRDSQLEGRWLDAATTQEPLRPLVEHAVQFVRRGRQAALDRLLTPLVQRYGRTPLERVHAATRIYLGEQQAAYSDPNQRPTFFYIPGLPPSAFFDRRMFAWIPEYEARFAAIKRELDDLLPTRVGREPVFDSAGLEDENLRGYGVAPSWDGYYFYRHGERRADNCEACPVTAAALDAIELIRIREHGPEVLFSVFTPGTHLLPHRGVTNARAVSHLPLMVPADCALKVGGVEHAWREGRTVVFDDTYEHEAWNRSPEVRVVLIADIWNPHLSEVERGAVADIIATIGDQRTALEAA